MKLHIGCGENILPGYINIDQRKAPGVDMELDLSKPIEQDVFGNEEVDEILGLHVFEHLPFNGIEQVLKSWYRILKKGGMLILEMPDFDQTVKNYINNPNDITILASIFGCQEHEGQFHHWGWNPTRLKFALEATGFKGVVFPPPQDYHKNLEPCLRVEATK